MTVTSKEFFDTTDPAPVESYNPDGRTPLLLLCDHASNVIPARLRQLGLHEVLLRDHHIAWDLGAADLTRRLARRLDAPALLSGYSRLVIDCNRAPGDPQSIPMVSDSVIVPGNQNLSDAAAQQRADACFWPYHHAVGDAVAVLWRHGPPPVLVAIHSFTPTFNGQHRPWHIGLLWNHDPRLMRLLQTELAQDRYQPALCIGDNQPYSARDIEFTLARHAASAGLAHVALELRQDLLADAAGREHWAGVVGDALVAALDERSLYRVEHF